MSSIEPESVIKTPTLETDGGIDTEEPSLALPTATSDKNGSLASIQNAIRALIDAVQDPELDIITRAQLRNTLLQVIRLSSDHEDEPVFVTASASPMPEKPYEGLEYEELLKLMEETRLLNRGTKNPWTGGSYVWEGKGMRLKEVIFGGFGRMLDDKGYQPVQMPRELPRVVIDRVCEGIVNLEEGTYWLAESRNGELRHSGQYANSSNDAVMSYYLADRVKSGGKILPFRGYTRHQIIRSHKDSVVPRPLVNSDENCECNEAYSIQETSEACEVEFEAIVTMMTAFFREMGIAFLTVDQSNWGNKPVAKKVTSFQTYAGPVKGSVRLATIYMHDDTFSKLFGLGTRKEDGSFEHAHQVGYGLWEGLIVPLLDHTADEHGLCIPPALAAEKIVFIPKNQDEENQMLALKQALPDPDSATIDIVYRKRYSKRLDKHRTTGTPLRISFGDNGQLIVSRRDTLIPFEIQPKELASSVPHLFASMSKNYEARSRQYMDSHIAEASRVEEIEPLSRKENKLVVFNHCGREECGKEMEKRIVGEFLGHVREYSADGCCIGCGQEGTRKGLFGRRAPTP